MSIKEKAKEMIEEIRETEIYSKERGKLSAPALDLIAQAYRELSADEAEEIRRELLKELRS